MNSSRTRLLRIASSDQVKSLSDSNSRFTVALNETLNIQEIKGYSVVSVSFPNVFNNISSSDLSNRLVILTDDGGGPIEQFIDLDEGWYTVDDLTEALTAEINNLIAPDTVTIAPVSAVNQRLQFTVTGGTTISYTNLQGSLATILGITETSPFLSTYTCDELTRLNGVTDAYVHSKVLASGNLIDAEGKIFSTAVCVPVRAAFGFWNHYESPDEDITGVMFDSPRNLQQIEIRLRALDGTILEIGQNELIIVMRVFY